MMHQKSNIFQFRIFIHTMWTVVIFALQASLSFALAPSLICALAHFPTHRTGLSNSKSPAYLTRSADWAASCLKRDIMGSRSYPGDLAIMLVRGGGGYDDEGGNGSEDSDDGLSEEDDDYTDDDEMLESTKELTIECGSEELEEDDEAKFVKLQNQASLSQRSRNFGITTALWSSLFFDVLLNKAKRCDLFPGLAASSSATNLYLIPSALLSSGFALASGTSFLLWRDLDIRAEMASTEGQSDYDVEGTKGDWFLSLSNSSAGIENDLDSQNFPLETRQRLYFHLSLFGLLSLGAHVGNYFSDQAPFLGMSASIINVHNTLTCVSALIKEQSLRDSLDHLISWPFRLVQFGKERSTGKREFLPLLFRLATVVAWVSCIATVRALFATVAELTGIFSTSPMLVNNARLLSLQISSLARLTLTAGVFQTIYKSTLNEKFRNHPFFSTLSGIMSSACLGVGGTMIFSVLSSFLRDGNLLSQNVTVDGALLIFFGVLSGYKSVSGFMKYIKSKEATDGDLGILVEKAIES